MTVLEMARKDDPLYLLGMCWVAMINNPTSVSEREREVYVSPIRRHPKAGNYWYKFKDVSPEVSVYLSLSLMSTG